MIVLMRKAVDTGFNFFFDTAEVYGPLLKNWKAKLFSRKKKCTHLHKVWCQNRERDTMISKQYDWNPFNPLS
jgi:aryl-alcohol dehydrogenase-like predicted oxidoreductase